MERLDLTEKTVVFFHLAILTFFLVLVAINVNANLETIPIEPPNKNLPNPAAVYCVNQGFKYLIYSGRLGEYGVCVFPDGLFCDEWAFYRGECFWMSTTTSSSSSTITSSSTTIIPIETLPDGRSIVCIWRGRR